MRVLMLSDIHAGGKHSITPPVWLNERLQPAYDTLSKIWDFYTSEVTSYGQLDAGILNGDGTDGPVRKDPTVMAYNDMDDQTEICADVLSQATVKHWYIVAGTGYHVSQNYEFEKLVCEKLNNRGISASYHPALRIKLGDHYFHIRHTGRRSDTPYGQYTQLMKEVERTRKRESRKGIPLDEQSYVIVRAHVHYYLHAESREAHGLSLPCYKLEGDDGFSRKMMAYLYDIGHVLVETGPGLEPHFRKRLVPFNITSQEDEVCLTT